MYAALSFTESQITLFEEIQSDVKTAIQELRDQVKIGQMNIDTSRCLTSIAKQVTNEQICAV